MSAALSNRLTALAADIRAGHEAIQRDALGMAERAIAVGHALIEAKTEIAHGDWMRWLTSSAGLSGRTARRYMQLARSGLEAATVANLGLRGTAQRMAEVHVRRPGPGQYLVAVVERATMVMAWRAAEKPDAFHVLVLGRIDGQDHSACTTTWPCSPESLPRMISQCGFPLGATKLEIRSGLQTSFLEVLRLSFAGAGQVDPRIDELAASLP